MGCCCQGLISPKSGDLNGLCRRSGPAAPSRPRAASGCHRSSCPARLGASCCVCHSFATAHAPDHSHHVHESALQLAYQLSRSALKWSAVAVNSCFRASGHQCTELLCSMNRRSLWREVPMLKVSKTRRDAQNPNRKTLSGSKAIGRRPRGWELSMGSHPDGPYRPGSTPSGPSHITKQIVMLYPGELLQ